MKEATWREPESSRQGSDERSERETQDGHVKATVTIGTRGRTPAKSVTAEGASRRARPGHREEDSAPGARRAPFIPIAHVRDCSLCDRHRVND